MDKKGYYIIGIFIITALSLVYLSDINHKVMEKIEGDISLSPGKMTENYTDQENQTHINNIDIGKKNPITKSYIKIRGKIFTGEYPITKNSDAYWNVNVIFDSNITEKEAKEIISGYEIPKPRSVERSFSYPEYYISAPKSDFESIKNRLEGDEYSNIQLANKIKITGENFTAAIWGVNNEILPGLRSSGIQLRKTMVMILVYGPETPQTESKNIMEQLDRDENIIETTVGFFFKGRN